MPLLIPFLIGASTTGYFWYNSKQEDNKAPTFGQEVLNLLAPIVLIVFVLLTFRWIYLQGSKNT